MNVSLREGYNDNVNTTSVNKEGSATTTIEPQLLVSIPLETTFFGLQYTYGTTYYSSRGSKKDQSHTADLAFSHTFSSRLVLDVHDNVVRGLQPELVQVSAGVPVITRLRGDYLYNNLRGSLAYMLAQRWTASVSGGWQLWRYDDPGNSTSNDRDVYLATIGAAYTFNPRTTLGVNYQYGEVDYMNPGLNAARNSQSDTGFLTLVRRFSPKLSLQASGGYELRNFGDGTSATAPSANMSLSYSYAPKSALSAGFSYQLSTTEVAAYRATETASLFGQINHAVTLKLGVSANVAYSISTFQNPIPGLGLPAGLEENAFLVGLRLTYEFKRWLNADLRYTYDQVSSDLAARVFDRNRVTMGLRLIY
jgi:hypothetical protein